MTEEISKNRSQERLINIVSEIVASYVSNNSVRSGDLAEIIGSVHSTLAALAARKPAPVLEETKAPAVSIKKSITPGFLICLEDGNKFKSLKRHLRTAYDMSPDHYRAKWGLPHDYPMVAPAYAASRSALAKNIGLGQHRAKAAAEGTLMNDLRGRGRPRKAD